MIKIFNLPDQISWQTAADNPIRLISGWATWHDVIFTGKIRTVETEKDGVDTITTFRCDTTEIPFLLIDIRRASTDPLGLVSRLTTRWIKKKKGANGETYSEFMARIAAVFDIPIGYVHPGDDADRQSGRLFQRNSILDVLGDASITTLGRMFDHIIANFLPDWHYFFRNGMLFITPISLGIFERIALTFRNGLISVEAEKDRDEPTQDKIITTLLIPRIQKESILEILSGLPPGEPTFYKVISFQHVSDDDSHFTISKAEPMEGSVLSGANLIDAWTFSKSSLLVSEPGE